MSCYHPLYAVRNKNSYGDDGLLKTGLTILGSRDNLDEFQLHLKGYSLNDVYKIPCGRCIGCRLDKSRQWADRMVLELDHTKKACFITLTFRDESIGFRYASTDDDGNSHYTVKKQDLQTFMKNLRGRKEFLGKEIRFFGCGEYGSKNGRPHYHLILFGVSKEDFGDIIPVKRNEFGDLYYHSDLLEDIWKLGICCLCDVSWKTMAYVSRYVTKKLTGPASYVYEELNIEPEFALMSRRPGISGYFLQDHYFNDHPDFDFSYTKLSFPDQKGSKTVTVPKYILDKLDFLNPELYNKIKASRMKYAEDREFLKMMRTDLDIEDYYDNEEVKKLDSFSRLRRTFESGDSLY